MHRFHASPAACREGSFPLAVEEARHATQVLRLTTGAPVTVLDGAGTEVRGELVIAHRREVTVRVRERITHAPPAASVTLFQCVPKGKTMEWIVEKATELGAAAVVPVLSERSAVRLDAADAGAKRARWERTALEAVKQCGNPWLTRIVAPVPLAGALALAAGTELALVASLQPPVKTMRASFVEFHARHGRAPASIALWIGPEGDFTPAEYASLAGAGTQGVSLGERVLRCETAALAGLALIFHELNPAESQG